MTSFVCCAAGYCIDRSDQCELFAASGYCATAYGQIFCTRTCLCSQNDLDLYVMQPQLESTNDGGVMSMVEDSILQ